MIRDTLIVFGFELRRSLRSPVWVLFGVFQPLLWLLLFAPLLEGLAVPLETFTAGLLVVIVVFSAFNVGYELVASTRTGVMERLAATPAYRSALMFGRILRDGLTIGVQAVILLAVAWLMGMRVPIAGALIALALAGIAVLSGSAASYALALRTRDENGLSAITAFFSFPLILLSGALIPLSTGPGWLEAIGHANPFFYVTQAGRDLFAGRYTEPSVPLAFALTLALAALMLAWATRSIRHAAG